MDDENSFLRSRCGERGAKLRPSLPDVSRFVLEITLDEAFNEIKDHALGWIMDAHDLAAERVCQGG